MKSSHSNDDRERVEIKDRGKAVFSIGQSRVDATATETLVEACGSAIDVIYRQITCVTAG